MAGIARYPDLCPPLSTRIRYVSKQQYTMYTMYTRVHGLNHMQYIANDHPLGSTGHWDPRPFISRANWRSKAQPSVETW